MFSFLNKYIWIILIAGNIGLGTAWYFTNKTLDTRTTEWSVAMNNDKAEQAQMKVWEDRYGQEHSRTIQFQNTLSEFKQSKDSTTLALLQIVKQQGIKLSNVQQLGRLTYKIDTTINRKINPIQGDTTLDFSDKNITNVITIKGDTASARVALSTNESIIWSSHKETINPPKKFFLWRWFQKKQTVTEVETILSNPLIKTTQQRFILLKSNQKDFK